MKLEPTDRNGVIIIVIMTLLMCSAFLTAQSIRKSHEERVWLKPHPQWRSHHRDTIPNSAFQAIDSFTPIIEHSQIPSPKVKNNGQVWLKVQVDTIWDFHRDSIFNVEWWMAEGDDYGSVKLERNDIPNEPGQIQSHYKTILVHTFLAPHEKQYYKHIKFSQWTVYRYQIDDATGQIWTVVWPDVPLLFYKQYSSYTIHTL